MKLKRPGNCSFLYTALLFCFVFNECQLKWRKTANRGGTGRIRSSSSLQDSRDEGVMARWGIKPDKNLSVSKARRDMDLRDNLSYKDKGEKFW